MARKTTGVPSTRSKKSPAPPAPTQVAAEAAKNCRPANQVSGPANVHVTVNMEEEIRVRAYELYLQRRATAGEVNGNPNQDWLIAEREIRSRHDGPGHHSA